MEYTKYGTELAAREEGDRIRYLDPSNAAGASAQSRAMAFNAGHPMLLIGQDAYGRRFTMHAGSVSGAHFTAAAAWGVRRAWHVGEDGTRRLVFRR